MTVVRNVVRDAVRAVIRGTVRAPSVVQRYFTNFNSTFQTHGVFTATLNPAGVTVYKFDVLTISTDYSRLFSFNTVTANSYVHVALNWSGNANVIKIETSGYTPGVGTIVVNDGKLHGCELHVDSSSGVIDLYVDGEFDYSTTHTFPPLLQEFRYHYINAGRASETDPLASFANQTFANLTVINDGALVVDSPLDDAPDASYFRNRATVLGSELLSDTPAWVDTSSASHTGTGRTITVTTTNGGNGSYINLSGLTVGETYVLDAIIDGEGEVRVYETASFGTVQATSFGGKVAFGAVNTDQRIYCRIPNVSTTTFTVGLKKSSLPLIEKVNFVPADTELMTEIDIGWLGQDVTPVPFDPGYFNTTGGAVYMGEFSGKHRYQLGPTESYVQKLYSQLGIVGDTARTTLVADVVSGGTQIRHKFGANRTLVNIGNSVVDDTQNGTDIGFGINGPDDDTTIDVSSFSAQRLIEVA